MVVNKLIESFAERLSPVPVSNKDIQEGISSHPICYSDVHLGLSALEVKPFNKSCNHILVPLTTSFMDSVSV